MALSFTFNPFTGNFDSISQIAIGAFGSTPNATGLSVDGDQVLTLQPADGTNPGAVSTTTQTFAGNKTFTGNISALNLSGTNTGDQIHYKVPVVAVSSDPIDQFASVVYDNGAGGVGATLSYDSGGTGSLPPVDGVTLSIGDRVLLIAEGNRDGGYENGIYTVTATNPWVLTRAPDFDEASEIITGSQIPAEQGTTLHGIVFSLTTLAPITVGSTDLNFETAAFITAPSIGNFDGASPSVRGLVYDPSNQIFAQSASTTVPGMVNTSTQTFGGVKNFTRQVAIGGSANEVQLAIQGNTSQSNNIIEVLTSGFSSLMTLSNAGVLGIASNIGSGGTITALQYRGSNAATATSGLYNLANLETIAFRNTLNNGDKSLYLNGTDTFVFDSGASIGGALNMNSHLINSVTDPVSAQDAATKAYVDASVAALQPLTSVYAATIANIAGTYLNGVSGVGATFTTTATTAFAVDGVSPPLNSRTLVKNQTNGFENGVYALTVQAVGGVSGAILTRTADYNTAADMNAAGLIPVINGTTNALSSWQQTAVIVTVGVDSLVFQEFTANPSLYLLKANNLSDVASASASFNTISPITLAGDLIVGSGVNAATRLGIGSNNTSLTSNGSTASWNLLTNSNLSGSAAITNANLAAMASTSSTVGTFKGNMSGSSTTPSDVTMTSANTASSGVFRDGSGNFSAGTITAALTGAASGNTTLTPTNHGVVISGSGNAMTATAAGSSGQPLLSGGASADPAYGTLGVAAGGTGQTSYIDGQLLIGNTSGNTLTKATLTAGTGIAITNGNGSISIASASTVASQTIAAQAISASAIDWSTGNMFTKTLGAATTFTFSNQISGQTIVVRLTNTASNWTVTWPTVLWSGGTAPIMTTGAKSDVYTFIYDGSNIYGSAVQNMS